MTAMVASSSNLISALSLQHKSSAQLVLILVEIQWCLDTSMVSTYLGDFNSAASFNAMYCLLALGGSMMCILYFAVTNCFTFLSVAA
ncbi:hypothetical protein KC19_VG286900 [Ceratodon purpureus]|uniref:Uncharacterized protein n=1 Tax=Ceratodon purpureus TaxID=3225 RepID=A0A8T0HVL2_CERPU|nr:hypothetical protein KC19_VG286900 [Ceratodon purpureus]